MNKKIILIVLALVGMVLEVNAKKKSGEDVFPESLPMKKDTVDTNKSENPKDLTQVLATPTTMERANIVTPSAQQVNDEILAGIKDSLIRMRKIKFSPELLREEKELKLMFDSLLQRDTRSEERIEINNRIFARFRNSLRLQGSFFYPFDSLQNIGRIYSDDYNIRVYTWCIELEDLSYRFYGLIQDLNTDKVWALEQNSAVYIPRETQKIAPRRWYGALYYKVMNIKKGDDPQYIVLGWSQPNPSMKMKIIDVLDFSDEKLLLGGDETFKGYHGKADRIVFTYCSNLNISLVYDEKKKRFVFDHVTPLSDEYDNPLGCNGPDMSYDQLKKKGKRWVLKKDVDVTNDFE
ncbi:MAG: hypothetical protein IJR32_03585 [Paludibacteraceae bacterium]|nr:hypothetical protein [Paludibacteraceae bacterium]